MGMGSPPPYLSVCNLFFLRRLDRKKMRPETIEKTTDNRIIADSMKSLLS